MRPGDRTSQAAFERLYTLHHANVLRFIRRRVVEPADASDLAANTFLVLWRRFKDAPASDVEARFWLLAIARRQLADHHRANRRRVRMELRLASERVPADGGPDHGLQGLREVLLAFAELQPCQRELLLLAARDGLSSVELGAQLGCSANAAAIRLHRARSDLKRLIVAG